MYTGAGEVTGTLDGVPFTSEVMTITAVGDTSGIHQSLYDPTQLVNFVTDAHFALSDGRSGGFLDTIFVTNGVAASPLGPEAYVSFIDAVQHRNILQVFSYSFSGYQLGPIEEVFGSSFNVNLSLLTSTGVLAIPNSALLLNDGSFSAAASPLPSALPLFISGLAGLCFAARGRRGKRTKAN